MTKFFTPTFSVIFVLISASITYGQAGSRARIDSLLQVMKSESDQLKKGFLYLDVAEAHVPSSMDSLIFYSKSACREIIWPKKPSAKQQKIIKQIFARANNNIGYAYSIQGRNVEALSYYNKALKIFEELNDIDGISKLSNNIGGIYRFAGNFKEAEKLYVKGLALLKGTNDSLGVAVFENNLGAVYKNLGNHSKALTHFKNSERIRRKLNDENGLASTLNNMGSLYQKTQKLDSAAQCFVESLALVTKTNNLMGITHAGINLGELEMLRGHYQIALKLGKESMNAAQKIKSITGIIDASEFLSNVYKQMRNFEKAFEMQKIYIENTKKVNEEELDRELILSELKNEFDKKAVLAKKENEKKTALAQKQKEVQQSIIFATIIVFTLVIVFIIVLYKRLKATREQARIIEKQNNDRKVLLQEIHHRVKNNFQIISSLLKLQTYSEDNPVVEKAFNGAINRIHAMSIVHEIIYKQDTFSNLSTRSYLNSLIENLKNSFDHESVELEVISVEDSLSIEQFIPIGIIINELITNSFKHAFPNQTLSPKISINLNKQGEEFELLYKDNGIGGVQSKLKESFGMGLIETMVDQLSGKMEVSTSDEWATIFSIKFEQSEKS